MVKKLTIVSDRRVTERWCLGGELEKIGGLLPDPACAHHRFVLMRCHHSLETASDGLVAEWLRRGLQILAPRFDSGRGLHYLFPTISFYRYRQGAADRCDHPTLRSKVVRSNRLDREVISRPASFIEI